MSRSPHSRVTSKNPNLTGPGLDLMDYDTAILYNDYLVPGLSTSNGASAPDLAEVRDGLYLPAYAGTGVTVEQSFFSIHILHDIHPDFTPTFHVHWTHNQATPTGNVKWMIDYSYANGYGDGAFGTPTTVSTTQAAPAQYVHQITPDDDMPFAASFEPDGQALCRIYRDPADAADTFEADAFLIGVDMHYRMGQIGTYERNRPFTSAGF